METCLRTLLRRITSPSQDLVVGGKERQDSVYNGFEETDKDTR